MALPSRVWRPQAAWRPPAVALPLPAVRWPLAWQPRAWLHALTGALTGEQWLVLGLLAVALGAHGLNMLDFLPAAAKDDEGIYTAQAWAVLREHRLTPYTYFYDHAPVGWLMLAAWTGLTGGPLAFGQALDSGRVFMLVLHLGSVLLLYRVARSLGCRVAAAGAVALLFSVSPLAVYYTRLVLLDNIMVFWCLLSLHLLLASDGRLSRLALSGTCFGLACLSKETAIVLAPAFLLLVHRRRQTHQGAFGTAGWLAPMLVVVSWYPLYALLKNELLPAGQSILFIVQGNGGGVSLTEALKWQATRSGGDALSLDGSNEFWQLVSHEWLPRDAVLTLGGGLAILANLAAGLGWDRPRLGERLGVGLLGLLPLAYLGRGGVVFDFYVLAAIPFLCLNIGVALEPLLAHVRRPVLDGVAIVSVTALLTGYVDAGALQPLYAQRPGLAGRTALPWIKQHLAADSRVITPDDFWTDLHEPGSGGPTLPDAHSHWKVASDPAVRDGVFFGDWRRVDYLIMTPGLEDAFSASGDRVAQDALSNAHLVREWQQDGGSVALWKVDHAGATEADLLARSQAAMAQRFEPSLDGAYASADGSVLSESEAYALLRDVWSDDRTDFARTWQWTATHLLQSDGLPAWIWQGAAVADAHTASDADADLALALLLAGRRWQDQALLDAGGAMVRAIGEHDLVEVAGQPFLAAGNWDASDNVVGFNPSYFAPYAYRIFAEVDPDHDWQGVIDSGYATLFAASRGDLGAARSSGLPPDWVGVDITTGNLSPLTLPGKGDTTTYGYDAPRTYWRVALDARWSGDGRAEAYLRQAGFLRDEVARKGAPSAEYAHDGSILAQGSSIVGTAGALAALRTLDPASAHALFAAQVLGQADIDTTRQTATWGNRDDLYEQAWGWFATALYADTLTDLWHAS